jgi:phosphatidate cytidylyltransferase
MLRTRVTTALVLLAVLALSLGPAKPWGFPALVFLFGAAGVGEWLVLCGIPLKVALPVAALSALAAAAIDHILIGAPQVREAILAVATAVWLVLALLLVVRGQFPAVNRLRVLYVLCGVLLPYACAIALLTAFREGLVYMLSIMALVWAADIAAYFVGRAFGRHKLAVRISPGKTVEGALGGVAAVWLVGYGCTLIPSLDATLFARLGQAYPLPLMFAALTVLTGASIVGDLFESSLKRQAGVKDSSRLLPGHGGVLDRIDALLPVIPAAVVLRGLL